MLFAPMCSSDSMSRPSTLVQIYLRQPPRPHITRKRLRLFDTHIWLQHHVCKIIGNATRNLALEAPVEGHPDLMDCASVNTQWPHAPCHHGPCLDLTTRCAHNQPVAMLNATFSRQFRAQLH